MNEVNTTWPNLFIVGAAKAGTTSLYEYLANHHDVYMSKVKEPHFFSEKVYAPSDAMPESQIDFAKNYHSIVIKDVKNYQRLFENRQEKILGDASPSYLWDSKAPYNIKKQCPDAKIIIILRDPIERAYSHYLMDYRTGSQTQPFEDALKEDLEVVSHNKGWGKSHLYIDLGLYAKQVARYYECFDKSQIKLFIFEEFTKNPNEALKEISSFLGIPYSSFSEEVGNTKHNAHATPKNKLSLWLIRNKKHLASLKKLLPSSLISSFKGALYTQNAKKEAINMETKTWLSEIYTPDIQELAGLVGEERLKYFKNADILLH